MIRLTCTPAELAAKIATALSDSGALKTGRRAGEHVDTAERVALDVVSRHTEKAPANEGEPWGWA